MNPFTLTTAERLGNGVDADQMLYSGASDLGLMVYCLLWGLSVQILKGCYSKYPDNYNHTWANFVDPDQPALYGIHDNYVVMKAPCECYTFLLFEFSVRYIIKIIYYTEKNFFRSDYNSYVLLYKMYSETKSSLWVNLGYRRCRLTLVLLNKLRHHTHFQFLANQITWSRLLI